MTGNRKTDESKKERTRLKAPVNTAPSGQCQNYYFIILKRLTNVSPTASMMYQYFVKIVPTVYVKTDGEVSSNVPFINIWFLSFWAYFTLKQRLNSDLPKKHFSWYHFTGVENKPVFSYQARESGQRSDRGPGAARGICLIWVITYDG